LEALNRGTLDLALIVSAGLAEKHDYFIEMSWNFEMLLVSHQRFTAARPRVLDLKQLRFILFQG
jgi:hypothetical protein